MADGAKSGLASGTSGSPQLTFKNDEMAIQASKNEMKLYSSITNKFPNDNQRGRRYEFTISNGRIKLRNGIRFTNFIIDEQGHLHLGNGHSFLANGKSVKAAGSIKVNKQGYIRRISNTSGHYQPSVAETLTYVSKLKALGLKIDNAWITIYAFDRTPSGYVGKRKLVYNGQVKHLERRLK